MIRWVLIAQALGAIQLWAAGDPLAARVVILANSRQPESVQLAKFYAEKRGIPRVNIISLPLPEAETIKWREFIDQVYGPLQDELCRRGWIDGTATGQRDRLGRTSYLLKGHHISYLVVCRGVPLSIKNDSALLDENTGTKVGRLFFKDEAAVDSELSLLAQSGYEITGIIPNPFFNQENVSARDAGSVIKVSRLDGPSLESARQLVTSAMEAERSGLLGRGYIDLGGPKSDGDKWLGACVRQMEELGFDGEVERTPATFNPAARFDAPVLYFGWQAMNLSGPLAVDGFKFPPGAIALHLYGFSAWTLHSDTHGWCGPLVARGVTATMGNVFEPYFELMPRPDLLLRALIQGRNFGDAAYYALPALSWESIAIGDPLYRPFQVSLEQQEGRMEQLPAALAPYALMRRANLLLRQEKTAEAWTLLRRGLQERPGLVLALACARMALARKAVPAAIDALRGTESPAEFRAEDWSLVHQVAGLLAVNGAQPAALQVYIQLVKMKAPTPAAAAGALGEAKAVAEAVGDQTLIQEFTRQLSALTPPPEAAAAK